MSPDPKKKGADSGSGDYRQGMRGHHYWIRLPEIYMWNLFLNIEPLYLSPVSYPSLLMSFQPVSSAPNDYPQHPRQSLRSRLRDNLGRVQQNLGGAPHPPSRLQPPLGSLSVTISRNLNFVYLFFSRRAGY